MKKYRGQFISGSTVSEKYDGVQGVWTGSELQTKTGNRIQAPDYFIKGLPGKPLKGELYLGRGRFDECRGIVTCRVPDERWRNIRYMVFEGSAETEYAETVRQIPIPTEQHLNALYRGVLNNKGEGIVIKAPNGALFKRKPVLDDDGLVIGHEAGKGKYAGLVGALKIKLRNGKVFNLGGLKNRDRQRPPRVGQVVKFTYQGFTSKGLPRSAAFSGTRAERNLNF